MNLADVMKTQYLTEEDIATICKEVKLALQSFYDNSIIHRRVCAENCLIVSDGSIKLGEISIKIFLTVFP